MLKQPHFGNLVFQVQNPFGTWMVFPRCTGSAMYNVPFLPTCLRERYRGTLHVGSILAHRGCGNPLHDAHNNAGAQWTQRTVWVVGLGFCEALRMEPACETLRAVAGSLGEGRWKAAILTVWQTKNRPRAFSGHSFIVTTCLYFHVFQLKGAVSLWEHCPWPRSHSSFY